MARVVFMGTPELAVPSLQVLVDHPGFEIAGVVTQPDRPAGRGQVLQPSAVKVRALALGLPVFQPDSLRNDEAISHLRAWAPDVLVVAAFGQILRKPVLELAPFGSINVHASLLPRWRGAAPIQYAIRAGDAETGVTIMKMDEGLDIGPMLVSKAIPIAPDETAATLHDKLAALGAEILPDALASYLAGKLAPQPQPADGVTLARTLKKEDGLIDWSQPAVEIDRQVRAFTPWPGTYTFLDGRRLKIVAGRPASESGSGTSPGTLMLHQGELGVQTGDGIYIVGELQPAGKSAMSASAYLAGHPGVAGKKLALEG